ncbi:hypothetical protein AVEN_160586-1, partial [Araneus ventricosus]
MKQHAFPGAIIDLYLPALLTKSIQCARTVLRRTLSSQKQSGAVEACWAHNPEVRGSKPRSA